jgi:multiple sugar transport system substrate-binding protein
MSSTQVKRHMLVSGLVGVAALAMALTACTAGGGASSAATTLNPTASQPPTTINVWGAFTGREAKIVQTSLDALHVKYPWLTATYVPSKTDADVAKAIASGQPPDVVMVQSPDNVAKFCSSGSWQDLTPYLEASNLDKTKIFPPAALSYTSYKGDQCSLPLLTDAFGLYYNKTLLADAGYTSPPKTFTELATMAKKLTQRSADGTIQVPGFVPTLGQMYEINNLYYGKWTNSNWYDSAGKSVVNTDPTWKSLLEWDKQLTDWYGYDNLRRWFAQYKDHEWDAGNAFEQGKVAMMMDGEWRTAFFQADNSHVDYGTAPFPVPDDQADHYGSGLIGGTVAGIPKGAPNGAASWLVLQDLTMNTKTLNLLADDLKNVPSTYDSLATTTLGNDPKFKTFMNIFQNANSGFKQLSPEGSYDVDTFAKFITDWQSGSATDLQTGLDQVAHEIDNAQSFG